MRIHQLTVANIKTALEMDQDASDEFDEIVALAPNGSTALALAQKAQFVESIHSIFILAENQIYAGYDTPTLVRAKIGI